MTSQSGLAGCYQHLLPHAALLDPAGVVVLKMSRWRRFWLLVGSLLLATWSLGLLVLHAGSFWGWAGVLLFGASAVFLVIELLRPDSLTLGRDEFSFTSLGRRSRFAWADVAEFGLLVLPVRGGNTRQVGMRMKRSGSSLVESLLSGMGGRFDASLPDSYGLPVEELATLMEEWRSAAARGS